MAGTYWQTGTSPSATDAMTMNYANSVLESLSRPGISFGQGLNVGQTDGGSPRSQSIKAFPVTTISEHATAASASGASQAGGQAGFERRVAWLEEDVAVLHRRLRDECGDGVGGVGGAAGDSGLRALVARLDGELSAERRAREAMEARMMNLEESIRHERKEREAQLRGFSSELETTMRGLIGRIDEGLSAGAAAMRERTDATEARLRSLIRRVDEGLSAGAAALQDTLSATGALSANAQEDADQQVLQQVAAVAQQMSGNARSPNRMDNEVGVFAGEQASNEQLIQSYDQLRQENLRLREQRAQLNGPRPAFSNAPAVSPGTGVTPSISPSLAVPQTMQVPGSGLVANQLSRNAGYATRSGGPQAYGRQ